MQLWMLIQYYLFAQNDDPWLFLTCFTTSWVLINMLLGVVFQMNVDRKIIFYEEQTKMIFGRLLKNNLPRLIADNECFSINSF